MTAHIKITKRKVDQLKADGADTFYWDADLPGFGVRVRGSGRKYYVVQYRADGRVRAHHPGPPRGGGHRDRKTTRYGRGLRGQGRRRPRRRQGRAPQGGDDQTARQAVSGGIRPQPLQAEHGIRVRQVGEVLHRPPDRQAQGARYKAQRHRRAASRVTGDALPGQPDAGGAVQDIQPGRGLGSSSGRLEPLPARQALQGGEARAVPQRRGVFTARTGAGRNPCATARRPVRRLWRSGS